MMAANYRHIGGGENRLGRHYSRFSAFWPPAALADQSLALRKSQNAGSNRRSRVNGNRLRCSAHRAMATAARGLEAIAPLPPSRHPCGGNALASARRQSGGEWAEAATDPCLGRVPVGGIGRRG